MSDDHLFSYLAGELNDADRRAFEARMDRDPVLRAEVEEWRVLAEARQLAHNEIGQAARDAAFLRALAEPPRAVAAPAPRASAWRRLWQWLWPTPASPLMPLGWALAVALSVVVLQSQPQDPGYEGPLTRGGGTCPQLRVDLPDTVTAKQLRNTLSQYAVSIVSGPDEDGRFVLTATRESSLHDAARALGALSTAPAPAGACPSP